MAVPETLRKLLTAPGPSGYEQAPAAVFREAAAAFAEITHDTIGSTVARVKGTGDGPFVAVVGHIDEIGLIVHHIDDDGFLWFTGVGGWDPVILVGQRVEIATRDGRVPGVVGKKPIHLLKEEERKKAPELKDLHIDIGAKDGDDARSMVRVGDVAVIAGEPVELPEQPRDLALDGQPARLLRGARGGAAGGRGGRRPRRRGRLRRHAGGDHLRRRARTTAYSLRPDIAIVVDVTFATDAPGTDEKELGQPQVRHRAGDPARLDARPDGLRAAARGRRGGGHPVHGRRLRALHGHRRRRLPPLARRHPVGGRLDPAALHALAGGDGRSSTTSTTPPS